MATAPPTINALPAPPDPNDRSTFNSRAYPWSVAQQTLATEANAVASNVYANAQDAATQANLATTNGAAQVALATTQANLATTNGAAQVALATTQANLATTKAGDAATSATTASTKASEAATSAADSEASRIAASKLNLGNKAAPPAADNQGDALLAGATYYDTTLTKWRVWTGAAWGDGISAVAGVSSVNGMTGNVVLPPTQTVTYDSRATLRSQTPTAGEMAVIDGLGLFVWESGSTEPDDDESCFATATGRWLLEAVHWDVVDAWQAPDDAVRDEFDEDEPLRFASSFASKVLTGTATSAITSVAAVTQVNFTGTVTGAAVGDRVIATPPDAVGPRIAAYARVTAANTVTVYLNNPSAATQTIATGTWQITVIKP